MRDLMINSNILNVYKIKSLKYIIHLNLILSLLTNAPKAPINNIQLIIVLIS